MNRNWKAKSLIAAGLAGCGAAVSAPGPHVVFILVDDLGFSDTGCYGNDFHETPNLDRMAREGMRFSQAYAAAAVCSPSRAAIQTGRYPLRTGVTDFLLGNRMGNTLLSDAPPSVHLPDGTVTLGSAMKKNGYRTAYIGKWHLNHSGNPAFNPGEMGYDTAIASESVRRTPKKYFAPFGLSGLDEKPDDFYLTDRLGDEAVRLITEYSREPDHPFFLTLSFYSVHTPIQPRPDLLAHYEQKLSDGTSRRWTRPDYAAMVHCVDENIGKLLLALEETGLDRNTLVLFTSDNGGRFPETSNYPLRGAKAQYHEGGIRVPFVARFPGRIPAGTESFEPFLLTDIFPTLLDVCGLPLMPGAHVDGLSLKSLLEGGAPPERDALFWHYPHYHPLGESPVSVIRAGDWKLLRRHEDGTEELYNLANDPGESDSLIRRFPEKAAELSGRLTRWIQTVEAPVPDRDPSFDPSSPQRIHIRGRASADGE